MGGHHIAALDSNPLTFFVGVMSDGYDPSSDSAEVSRERAAVLRSYLYSGKSFTLLRTVVREYRRIQDPKWLRRHEDASAVLLLDAVPSPPARQIDALTSGYLRHHGDADDCRILAEANALGVPYLLTFDLRFLRNLGSRSRATRLVLLSAYWRHLAVPPGTTPRLFPKPGNPLADSDWWRV